MTAVEVCFSLWVQVDEHIAAYLVNYTTYVSEWPPPPRSPLQKQIMELQTLKTHEVESAVKTKRIEGSNYLGRSIIVNGWTIPLQTAKSDAEQIVKNMITFHQFINETLHETSLESIFVECH